MDYRDGDRLLEGYVAWDDEATYPAPAVLVAHAWGGQGELEQAKARALAELGYVGFALDMYGKGVRGSSREENARLIQPFLDDRPMLMRRIGAALAAVKGLPEVDGERVAAIGFCFGGLCVLDLARSGADLAGVVSFHGLLNPLPESGGRIRARVLVLHGHEDPMAPVEQVVALERELTEAGADWQVHAYGNTVHAFTNPQANDPDFGTVYDARADRRSWQSMRAFLEEIFS